MLFILFHFIKIRIIRVLVCACTCTAFQDTDSSCAVPSIDTGSIS